MSAAASGHVDPVAALAGRGSPTADEAFLELACHLAEGCATCRGAVDALAVAAFVGEPSRPIVAALLRLRNTRSWATLSSDHFAAAVAARRGEAWGAFAFLVVEESFSLCLSGAGCPDEVLDQVFLLIDRLAQRHPGEPKIWVLWSRICADLVAIFCASDNKPLAAKALSQALAHGRRCWREADVRLHLHEASAVLAQHRRQLARAWRHLLKAHALTGKERPLRAFELVVEIAVQLAHLGAAPAVIENLLQTGLTTLEPLHAEAEPGLRAHLLFRQARLLVALSHDLSNPRSPVKLPLRRAADELEAAAELFEQHTDRGTQGLRLLVLAELWALERSDPSEAAFRAALDLFEGNGGAAFGAEPRAELSDLTEKVAGGTVH